MATTKKRGGRPLVKDPRKIMSLRLSEEEKKKFEKAAKSKGQELSAWIRLACHNFASATA